VPGTTSSRNRASVALVALVTVAFDWITKAIASATLDLHSIDVGSVITLRLSHNPGVAFGMGDRLPGAVVIALTAGVTVVVLIAALRGAFPSLFAAGLVVGGAVANLGDRLTGGSVVDFLDLGWWPSFNLADVAITSGCALVALTSFRSSPEPTSSTQR
jgi:signal peptidase II